jgi:hypothetical protein
VIVAICSGVSLPFGVGPSVNIGGVPVPSYLTRQSIID